jgi:hypothetical protein
MRLVRRLRGSTAIFLACLALAVYFGAAGRPELHGDGLEYIVQTQSLVFDHSLGIATDNRREYWNRTNPYGVALEATKAPGGELVESNQAGGGFGGLYPDRFGAYRYYHFWAYSLFVAPFYLAAHLLDSSGGLEYQTFKAVNVLLLAGFLALLFLGRRTYMALALVALALCTPLVPYCDWQHPELFSLFFTYFAFWAAERRGRITYLAPLGLGLAATQNLPLILFFPFLGLIHAGTLRSHPAIRRACLFSCYAGGCLLAVSSLLYFKHYFGTSSVIAAIGAARLEYASVARTGHLFFSPLVGAMFFYPASVLPLLTVVTRKNVHLLAAAVLAVIAAGWLSTSTGNFNSGQIGSLRYAVWLMAPLWYCTSRWLPPTLRRDKRSIFVALSLAVCVGFVVYLRTDRLLAKETGRFGPTASARPEIARLFRWTHYQDDPETLVENILGYELADPAAFNGIYLWDLGRQEYLWVFSAPALDNPGRVFWITGETGTPRIQAAPEQPLRITRDGERVSLEFSAATRRQRHPVFGEYLLVWSSGRVDKICANSAVHVRSDRMIVVEEGDCGAQSKAQPH